MTFGAHLNKHIEYHGKIIENPVIILIRAKNIGNAFLKFVGVPAWRDWSTSPETTMISTVSAFTKEHGKTFSISGETKALDIGCGIKPRNPFGAHHIFGVDIRESRENGVIAADLFIEPIPFKDDVFDFATAHDFIEHIPRIALLNGRTNLPFIELMNEVHRVLKPGGLFFFANTGLSRCGSLSRSHPCKYYYGENISSLLLR